MRGQNLWLSIQCFCPTLVVPNQSTKYGLKSKIKLNSIMNLVNLSLIHSVIRFISCSHDIPFDYFLCGNCSLKSQIDFDLISSHKSYYCRFRQTIILFTQLWAQSLQLYNVRNVNNHNRKYIIYNLHFSFNTLYPEVIYVITKKEN